MDAYAAYAYTIIKNKLQGLCTMADIEEYVSDVFLSIYEMRNRLDIGNTSLKALVSVIAKRRAFDAMRQYYKACEVKVPLDEVPGEAIMPDGVEEQIVEAEIRCQLIREIKSLGKPDSEILTRKYFFGQSTKEISAALGMKANTIDKRVSRGLEKLRERMKGVF